MLGSPLRPPSPPRAPSPATRRRREKTRNEEQERDDDPLKPEKFTQPRRPRAFSVFPYFCLTSHHVLAARTPPRWTCPHTTSFSLPYLYTFTV
ncbi:hypothetical protein VTO73DRAFT_13605 [Trametes versicolor]